MLIRPSQNSITLLYTCLLLFFFYIIFSSSSTLFSSYGDCGLCRPNSTDGTLLDESDCKRPKKLFNSSMYSSLSWCFIRFFYWIILFLENLFIIYKLLLAYLISISSDSLELPIRNYSLQTHPIFSSFGWWYWILV
jgi:hypothetical protein